MSDDETPNEPQSFGMAMPIPEEVLRRIARDHDAQHARIDDAEATVWRWVQSLDGEALWCLKWITTCNRPEYAAMNGAKWEGVAEALMRARGLDPDTGTPWGADLLPTEDASATPGE